MGRCRRRPPAKSASQFRVCRLRRLWRLEGKGGGGRKPGQAGQPAGQASQLAKGARRRSFLRAAFAAWGATAGSRPAIWLLVCPARRSNGGLRPRRPQVDTHTEVGVPLFKKIYARTASSRGLAPHKQIPKVSSTNPSLSDSDRLGWYLIPLVFLAAQQA